MKKLLLFSYFCLLFFFVFFSYLFVDGHLPKFFLAFPDFSNQHREIVTYGYVAFLILLFTYYGLFLFCTRKKYLSLKDIKVLILGSVIILFLSYPVVFSYDIFNYLSTSKTLFLYHENPYIVMPIEFVNEPYLQFTRAANKIALYGPSWIALTGIPYFLVGFNVWTFLFGIKLMVAVFYVWTTFLIWKLTKNQTSVVFFALNPLVLFEVLVGSHNDIVMISFCLFAFLSIQNKKVILSFISFIISILIKYATVLLMPIWLWIAFLRFKNKKINWDKTYLLSAFIMFFAFLLSPLREEMYPWYAIWFLPFVALTSYRQWLIVFCFLLSVGLMFRYIPIMYTGMYHGPIPLYREVLTCIPLLFFPFIMLFLRKR